MSNELIDSITQGVMTAVITTIVVAIWSFIKKNGKTNDNK